MRPLPIANPLSISETLYLNVRIYVAQGICIFVASLVSFLLRVDVSAFKSKRYHVSVYYTKMKSKGQDCQLREYSPFNRSTLGVQ